MTASRSADACPHCGADGCLAWWRKLAMGPLAGARCRRCGRLVGLDVPRACAALGPAALVVVAAFVVRDPGVLIVIAALGITGSGALTVAAVPLCRDELS